MPIKAKSKPLKKNYDRPSLLPLRRSRTPKKRERKLKKLIKKLKSKWPDISRCSAAANRNLRKKNRNKYLICSTHQISRKH